MILGIDLGTCNTVAATLSPDGRPLLVTDATTKENFTPSVLIIDDKMALVGNLAEQYIDLYPDKNSIRYFKRYFGTQQPVYFDKAGNSWFSETLAAMMLKKIRFDAEMAFADTIDSVVITVPAHYNDSQRKSVLEAANLADINLAAIIEEPVAAALSYMNTNKNEDEIILVYDFGGGTFDLTLITRNGTNVHVLAKDGLSNLGGKEFDEIIGNKILEDYQSCFSEDISSDIISVMKLRKISEKVKLEMCSNTNGKINKWVSLASNAFEFNLNLTDFENKSHEILATTQRVVNRCLKSVGFDFENVDKIIMVGGTSQIPFIKNYWQNKINPKKQKLIHHEPFSSVAYGAALYAGSISKNQGIKMPLELKTVSTYNIAIQNEDKVNDILIFKNSPLPILAKRMYNLAPNQKLDLPLVQYWDENEISNLGTICMGAFQNLTPLTVELSIENRANGTIGIKLKEASSGKDLQFVFEKVRSNYEYESSVQKKLLNSVVINNTY